MSDVPVDKLRPGLRFVFVTRHLNRSGFTALRACLEAGFRPQAVIVSTVRPALVRRWRRPIELAVYRFKCWFYRCDALRTLDSEELFARNHGVPVIALGTLKSPESEHIIAGMDLDLIVVAGGWHEKIPLSILKRPRYGSINLHPSLLPEFRGTSVTRWQVLAGVERSGITIHHMDENFDTGTAIAQRATPVSTDLTPQELFQVLSDAGEHLLVETLDSFAAGRALAPYYNKPDPRYDRYYSKWQWDWGRLILDPADKLDRLHFQVMAASQESYEYPGPLLRLNGRIFIIRKTKLLMRSPQDCEATDNDYELHVRADGLYWERRNEDAALLITRIQPFSQRYYLKRADHPRRWFNSSTQVIASRACEKGDRLLQRTGEEQEVSKVSKQTGEWGEKLEHT